VHPPLQPPNDEPAAGTAVSVTTVPSSYGAAHVPLVPPASTWHAIPAGALVTDPAPDPAPVTVSVCVGVAVTVYWTATSRLSPAPEIVTVPA
jgi:hypothetical protein